MPTTIQNTTTTTGPALNGQNGHQSQPSTQTYTFKPTDEPCVLDPLEMEEELRRMDDHSPVQENATVRVAPALARVPMASPWYARLGAWLVKSVALIITFVCSLVIGALAAVPLTPGVYDIARHYGRVGFWTYHWTKFSCTWLDHYTDSLVFWNYVTAGTVAAAVFLLALCSGRSE